MARRKVPLEVASLGVLILMSTLIVSTYGGCEFKSDWVGKWFINGIQNPLSINLTWMETKGRCVDTFDDKFIVEDPSDGCLRCMVIHERHQNVLQFKETYCDGHENIESLCAQIGGDAVLYSMFRLEPLHGPIACPFKGPPFTFSYNRGNGECGNPVSRIDQCTDDSRLSIQYQACPDVQGTESTVEELLCVATWRDGGMKFLIAKVYAPSKSIMGSFRCYAYEKVINHDRTIVYHVSQSGDASCTGVTSATEGSKTMKLTKIENAHIKCKYPTWVTQHHHWHTLDYKKSYHFSHKNATLKITEDANPGNSRSLPVSGKKSNTEMRIVCHSEVKTDSHHAMIAAHITSGCNSGYICLAFYRRDSTVIELQQSTTIVQIAEDACSPANFTPSRLPFITLITASLHQRKCPHLGRYLIIGQSEDEELFTRLRREIDSDSDSDSDLDWDSDSESESDETVESTTNDSALQRMRREGTTVMEREEIKKDCDPDRFETLKIGCSGASDTMEFESNCGVESNSEYSCYGSWEENDMFYLIASPVSRKSTEARRYCFISTPVYEGDEDDEIVVSDSNKKRSIVKLMLSAVAGSCSRNIQPGFSGIKSFNFSLVGPCAESKSPDNGGNFTITTFLFVMSLLTFLFGTR